MRFEPQLATADIIAIDRLMPVDSTALAELYGVFFQLVVTLLVLAPLAFVVVEIAQAVVRKNQSRFLVVASTAPVVLLGLCLAVFCFVFVWLPWLLIGLFCLAGGISSAVDNRRRHRAKPAG